MNTAPTLQAVALIADENAQSSKIVGRGEDELARLIIEEAKKHSIPIQEEPELVRLLSEIKPGDMIPDELHLVVAETLSFLFELGKTD